MSDPRETRKQQLLRDLANLSGTEITRYAQSAELNALLAQDLVSQIHQSTIVFHEALAHLESEIKRHRESLEKAASASDTSATALVRWTRVLAAATVALVLATAVLGWATLRTGH